MKKLFIFSIFLVTCISSLLFGFDWPQNGIDKNAFSAYFGQERGKIVNKSLIFLYPESIKTVEKGRLLAIMTEENDESIFFPSTLGNAVFIAHSDNLVSVYGNLDSDSMENLNKTEFENGETIADTGNTAWQENHNGLELEILDVKNKTAINPKILMTHSDSELPLELKNISLRNKNGTFFDLNTTKALQSGVYKVYCKKNAVVCPYRTSISVNGIEADAIYFDTVLMENNRACVNGQKNKYSSEEVYPDDEKQLLGEIALTPGRSTISITIKDFLGESKNLVLNISAW